MRKEKTLREITEQYGVTRRAIQGYEKKGLVTASGKNKYGYLLYDEEALEKIRQIRQYRTYEGWRTIKDQYVPWETIRDSCG